MWEIPPGRKMIMGQEKTPALKHWLVFTGWANLFLILPVLLGKVILKQKYSQ